MPQRVCHQRSVSRAAFYAVPHLVAIAAKLERAGGGSDEDPDEDSDDD